jgi:hypothetical protein
MASPSNLVQRNLLDARQTSTRKVIGTDDSGIPHNCGGHPKKAKTRRGEAGAFALFVESLRLSRSKGFVVALS